MCTTSTSSTAGINVLWAVPGPWVQDRFPQASLREVVPCSPKTVSSAPSVPGLRIPAAIVIRNPGGCMSSTNNDDDEDDADADDDDHGDGDDGDACVCVCVYAVHTLRLLPHVVGRLE